MRDGLQNGPFVQALTLIVAIIAAADVDGAVTYRFVASSEGARKSRAQGSVVVDGTRWRINYEPIADTVTVMTAVLGKDDGSLVALNDENRTWFRLPSRKRLEADSSLFSFGERAEVSNLKITLHPAVRDSDGSHTRIAFSYRIKTKIEGEKVRGEVWGTIRIRSTTMPIPFDLPWKPVELRTGLAPVDEALTRALDDVEGTALQCEIEVSRKLEGGIVLAQLMRRSIDSIAPATIDESQLTIPSGYEYQEPVIGVVSSTKR